MATTHSSHRSGSPAERTYGQYCPIATGLDVIGDRWVLLILRDLAIADRRFTDLRRDLPGIAPNLLTERLRSLQSAGLVESVELPPPVARTVYRLTEAGRGIVPVLRAVARFGVQFLDGEPTDTFDARRAASSLLVPWWRRGHRPLRARLVIAGHDPVDVVTDEVTVVVVAPDGDADVTVTTSVGDLVAARRAGAALQARMTGDREARRAFLEQFDLRLASRRR